MEPFKCCECEKVFFSLPWWGTLDTCLNAVPRLKARMLRRGRWSILTLKVLLCHGLDTFGTRGILVVSVIGDETK